MTLRLLAKHRVFDGTQWRRISVCFGDLSRIPPEHKVDLLVLSAFPNDYVPTPNSLIGALHRQGLSVADLAADMEFDLRRACQFWLSKPLTGTSAKLNIGRVACFEPSAPTDAASTVGAVFRGLFPFLEEDRGSIVAMNVLAAGDQGESWETMFESIVKTAEHWMSRGLPINELKIVIRDPEQAQAASVLLAERRMLHLQLRGTAKHLASGQGHDIFLSFAAGDGDAASLAKKALLRRVDVRSVFDFRDEIRKGANWQAELDEAISKCRAVVALISPEYERSPECQEELMQARLRHKHEPVGVLVPVYWSSLDSPLKLWIRAINYADCREKNLEGLEAALSSIEL